MGYINRYSIQKKYKKRSGAPYGAPSTNEKYFERYVKWITDDSRKYYIYPSIYIMYFGYY